MGVNAWELADVVYRELVVQALTQVRRTGARPLRIRSIVTGYRVMKLAVSVMIIAYLAVPLIAGVITHLGDLANTYLPPPYAYSAIYFIVLMTYVLLAPLTTSVMGYPVVGDLLRTLGLDERFIRRVATIAIVRAVDIPIASSIAVAVAVSAVMRTAVPALITGQAILLGLAGPLISIIAMDTVIRRRGSVSATLTRALMTIANALIWLIALALLILSNNPGIVNPVTAQYIPIISDPLATNHAAALINSVVTTTALLAIDAYLIMNAGTRLLAPRIPGGPESLMAVRRLNRGLRFRSAFIGLVRYYTRQLFSARGSLGLVIGGLIMAVFLYVSLATSMGRLTQFELLIGIMTYAAPLALITSFLPVMLYNAEYAALPIILTMPITPVRRMLAKIPMALATYYALAAPMIIILTALHYVLAIPLILALAVSPMASTAMAAVIFQLEVKDYLSGSQALALLNLVSVILIIITALTPIIAFIAVQVITANTTYATTAMAVTGITETGLLTLILIILTKE